MSTTGGPTPESTTRLALAPSAETGSLARRTLRQLFAAARVDSDTCETAVLLATELVSNAVEHGHGSAYLDATVEGGAIRLEVTDSSTVEPRPSTAVGEFDERGRGLILIDALASRWGVRPRSDGKTVWCELDLSPHPCG